LTFLSIAVPRKTRYNNGYNIYKFIQNYYFRWSVYPAYLWMQGYYTLATRFSSEGIIFHEHKSSDSLDIACQLRRLRR
jgi:hypothetical protein